MDPSFNNRRGIERGNGFWDLRKEASLNLSVPPLNSTMIRMLNSCTHVASGDEYSSAGDYTVTNVPPVNNRN